MTDFIFPVRFPLSCKVEVRWMFQHLDLNSDGILSLKELYDLEHDQNEMCLKSFLQQCDTDLDTNVNPTEWCKCFQRSERPCDAVKHKISTDLLGIFKFKFIFINYLCCLFRRVCTRL